SPHWIYKTTKIMGDAVVAFTGKCDVEDSYIADLEDLMNKKAIRADRMLHFIVEIFGRDTVTAAALQSVFMSEIQSLLLEYNVDVTRKGDDLFVGDGKLSISIASVSPVSALIHIGLNITNEGTPVLTSSLSDFNIDPARFAVSVMERINSEYSRIILAATKVVPRYNYGGY
ncbi:MAG: DUF366 family protein, partial [Oligoflexia bacterium]|nr:DUF366 family protein [Oligoflexia bacterium]